MTLQLTSGLQLIVWELLNYVRGHKTIAFNQVFLTCQKFMSLKILFNMSSYYLLFSSSTVNNLHSTRLFCSFPHCALLLHPSLWVIILFWLISFFKSVVDRHHEMWSDKQFRRAWATVTYPDYVATKIPSILFI